MTMDSWVVNDLTPEQREIFCNGGEVIMDEGTEHEYVYSAQSIIDEGDWLEVQMGTDFFESVKIADQPDAVTDYTILNSDVFIKYNKDNFLENYICTMYNASERNGEPYCFSPNDDPVESIVSLFGEENCIDGGGTQCNAIDDEELWSCEIFDSIASCYASKNGGNYGAMLESNIYYDFPEPYEQYDELVFYNGEPLSIYSNATWNEITPACMFRCLTDVGPDEYLTPTRYYSLSFDATSENSAHVDLTLYDSSDLTIETSVAIQTDPETGDSWVVVGDPDYGICSVKSNGFDYTQFTFQGAPLSSVDKIQEVVEEYACQNFNMQFEVLDTECIKKLIGEPQVTTLQEIQSPGRLCLAINVLS